MDNDHTQPQSDDDLLKARQLSMHGTQPPAPVPGYDLTQLLGTGAYGEVWIGLDRTTGREVAVKFLRHRQGVDWSLLSREVEKLVFLSADRYVVQLLDVGWDADPPYYVMEYMEHGSLEQRLQREGQQAVERAVALFHETAIGLNHAHAKGVLHCDLKPANILLDQDGRPRLADFGQARLSHEQTPSLGTLFYMAPEQADLEAVPDAQWDVYALGAILYRMLTGQPPFYSDDISRRIDHTPVLSSRLRVYRQWITSQSKSENGLRVAGLDRALGEIIARCLDVRASSRYANVQEVLSALDARELARSRRPLLLLGIVGPLLLMIVMGVFGWRGYHRALQDSDRAVAQKVVQNNALAANFVAGTVATEIERYFRAVDDVAHDGRLDDLVLDVSDRLSPLLSKLADPDLPHAEFVDLREEFLVAPARHALQTRIESLMADRRLPRVASWFVCDQRGTQIAAVFNRSTSPTIGSNYAYRTYCHGGLKDLDPDARPLPGRHILKTHLSAPLRSTATHTLKLAVSTPLFRSGKPDEFIGVLALTVEVGDFLTFAASRSQFAVLVDGRDDGFRGTILHHPLFTKVFHDKGRLPAEFSRYRVPVDQKAFADHNYHDPLGDSKEGKEYNRTWIAARADVSMTRHRNQKGEGRTKTGLIVLIQEDKEAAMRPVRELGGRLAREGLFAIGGIVLVVLLIWYFVLRVISKPRNSDVATLSDGPSIGKPTPSHSTTTILADLPDRKLK